MASTTTPIEALDMSKPVMARALRYALQLGLETAEELQEVDMIELLKIKGCGKITILKIFRALKKAGFRRTDEAEIEQWCKRPTPRSRINLVGQIFGRLTVLSRLDPNKRIGGRQWLCLCACGNEHEVATSSLVSGSTKSCGCLGRDIRNASSILAMALAKDPVAMKRHAEKILRAGSM